MLGRIITKTGNAIYKIAHIFKWRFGSLPIKHKLIIITGILVISMLSMLSFIFFQNGKKILNERLEQTCDISIRHVSQSIKSDLLSYYKSDLDENDQSTHVGYIREAILDVSGEKINGLEFARVINRNGVVIAHTKIDLINTKIPPQDSIQFQSLREKMVRQNGDTIEYIHPIIARKGQDDEVFLGVTTLGFSNKVIMAPIKQAAKSILSITLIITLISVILIFVVAHRMTRQIEELGKGVHRVNEGDLKEEIPVLTRDELGKLANEFNSMIKHLHEKLYMQKFVSKYTIKMIRDRYSNGQSLDGESRDITILFSDVRRFSNLTEKLSAKEIVKLINVYLNVQAQIIEKNHGVVDKFIGDQVMAIFDGKDQADYAIKTAVEIQRAIRVLNTKRAELGAKTLNLGIGVNAGPAVMGNMGSKNRMDYTVIGDVVNLAARLCAIAEPGQIIAPIEMADKLSGNYPTTQLNPVWVKGRSKPIATFEVDYDHAIIM